MIRIVTAFFAASAIALTQVPEPGEIVRLGPGVTSPVPIHRPDPDYSEEARKAGVQGTVMIRIVINEAGKPSHISVVSPLGCGLDEKAVQAVERWDFTPAVRNGHPVAVEAMIEVNFHLNGAYFDAKEERRRTTFNLALSDVASGSPQKASHAIKTIRELAGKNYPPAMGLLGRLEIVGKQVPSDTTAGLDLVRRAASKHYAGAMFMLGMLYLGGSLVPLDREKGLKLLMDASVLGSTEAQWYLGQHYETGDGLPKETDRARRYFRLCAARGSGPCQFRLARLMFVEASHNYELVQAEAWAELAADSGILGARELLEEQRGRLKPDDLDAASKLKVQLVQRSQYVN